MHLISRHLLRILPAFTATAISFSLPARAEPPPTSAEPKVVEPAPGQAAAAAPAAEGIAITATCSLGDHHGVDEPEARTAADVVCHELARRGATNTQHEVRFGKLGGRTMVTLASRSGNAYDERRTFVTGLDEIHVAGPRVADALATGKPLDETRTVDNVLTSETTPSKVQRGSSVVDGSLFGVTALNTSGGASAGVDIGFTYRAGSIGIGAHGRAGGIGSGEEKIALASLDVGGRLYFSSGDTSPFLGAGLGVSHFALSRDRGPDVKGSGVGAYATLGLEMLRTHHMGFTTSLRADTPFYALEGSSLKQYVVPLSLNLGLIFH
jgi:hypothetical protein